MSEPWPHAVYIESERLQALVDKAANYERLERLLRRYVAQHAGKYAPPGCNCGWCTEARDLIDA